MVQDLSYNLCESLVENIGGVSGATPHKAAVATPVITLTDNSVTITCATTGATIYYTLDGSTPTSGSTQYSAAFTLDSSCTIKAIAIKGGKSSGVAEESYVKPITYLTQWKIVGNSEVHGQEIWSCGEYNSTDGKYHILVQPLGGSIADIALTEPLRKVNNVADTIEFPSDTDGKALVTRNLYSAVINTCTVAAVSSGRICAIILTGFPARMRYVDTGIAPLLCNKMETLPYATCISHEGIATCLYGTSIYIRNGNIEQTSQAYQDYFDNELGSVNFIYQLATPTTKLIDAPQIAEANSYTCVISQGGKAVSWSSFETE